MRRTAWVARVLGLFAGAGALSVNGCFFTAPVDCEHDLVCSSLASSGGGETPPACVPSMNNDPVADTCGIFVSSSLGKDGNKGTKSEPLASLQQALDLAKGRPVYVCAETLNGSVTVASTSAIYGGLDCAKGWSYVGGTTKSTLAGEADNIAVTIETSASGTKFVDFTLQSPSATAPGGSSIAMLVDGAMVELLRSTLEAGDGKDGAAGESFSSTAQDGAPGNNGSNACSAATVVGGNPVNNMCSDQDSTGGAGGTGFVGGGGAGSPGSPGAPTNAGSGETATAACTLGGSGANGGPGGAGGGATGLGQISKSGYTGVAGPAGTLGKPGQGGGGGGGAKGGTGGAGKCPDSINTGGASGGSGGAGGCGGIGGKGGGAGGASIALISLAANVTLSEVTLRTGSGGRGGDGGVGQQGGIGGPVGKGGSVGVFTALKPGCNGGLGGAGGKGGQGGGGLGGHAIGLAYYVGASAPSIEGVTFEKKGTPGVGGSGADIAGNGAAGVQVDVQAFP